jgi:predicted enzyme related to lactoylglutathione lyase
MGNPFVHLDLSADDVGAAKAFYKKVFDWKFKDFPQMNWSGIDVGQGTGGGIGTKNMPNQPTAWTAYVGVDSVKKSLAKAEKAGATVLVPQMPVGDMGFLGVFQDPQGAVIGVWEAAKPAKAAAAKKAPKKAAAKKPAKKKR